MHTAAKFFPGPALVVFSVTKSAMCFLDLVSPVVSLAARCRAPTGVSRMALVMGRESVLWQPPETTGQPFVLVKH